MKTFHRLLLAGLLVALSPAAAWAQGAWLPDRDLERPRTMIGPDGLDEVRDRLGDARYFPLFEDVTTSAFEEYAAAGPLDYSDEDRASVDRARTAKNAAFLLYLDRRAQNGAVVALTADERTTLRAKAIDYLATTSTDVPSVQRSTDWQWLTNVITMSAQAYDLLAAAGGTDDLGDAGAHLQGIVGELYEQAEISNPFFGGYWDQRNDNLSLKTAGALALAGLVFKEFESGDSDERPANWMDRAGAEIELELFGGGGKFNPQSAPGVVAGYAEGPHYFSYTLQNLLPYFVAERTAFGDTTLTFNHPTGGSVEVRSPLYNENYLNLFNWASLIRMPDGRMPPLGDSFVATYIPEMAMVDPRFAYPNDFSTVGTSLSNELSATRIDFRAEYIAHATEHGAPGSMEPRSLFLPQAGNAVFRSGPADDEGTLYAHVIGENGNAITAAGGHNQADPTSFLLFQDGDYLVYDPGYIRFEERDLVANADDHNIILVDGAGPTAGSPGFAGGADAFIENYFETSSMTGSADGLFGYGEVRTTYEGALIERQTALLPGFFVVADVVERSGGAAFTWQLHGNGLESDGTYTAEFSDHGARYSGASTPLTFRIGATSGGSFETRTALSEVRFGETAEHTATDFVTPDVPETRFLAVLHPGDGVVRTLSADGDVVAFEVNGDYVVAAQQRSADRSLDGAGLSVGFDGRLLIGQAGNDAGTMRTVFFEQGTHLTLAGDTLASASQALDLYVADQALPVALKQGAFRDFTGFVQSLSEGGTAVVRLSVPVAPRSVSGVEDWSYDADAAMLSMTVTDGSRFSVATSVDTEDDAVLPASAMDVSVYPNPFRAQAAVELTLPRAGLVRVALYDVLGRRVRTVHDGTLSAGKATLSVDAHDLPAGLYWLHVTDAAGKTTTHSMINLR